MPVVMSSFSLVGTAVCAVSYKKQILEMFCVVELSACRVALVATCCVPALEEVLETT